MLCLRTERYANICPVSGKDTVVFITKEDQEELMTHENAVLKTDEVCLPALHYGSDFAMQLGTNDF